MNVTAEIRLRIENMSLGEVFKYTDFNDLPSSSISAVAKALSRLVSERKIKKVEKGVFFKPKITKFGEIKPDVTKILKKELEDNKNKKPIGYITGTGLYNQLGLTTQVSNVIEVATNTRKMKKTISGIKVKYTQVKSNITENNIKLLQILDALKNIKRIPDSNINDTYKILKNKIFELLKREKENMVELAIMYSPITRALLGSILEQTSDINLEKLENSLNALTKFDIEIIDIKNKKRWNIK